MNTQRTRVVTGSVTLVTVAVLAGLIMGQAGSQSAGKDSPLSERRVAAARQAYELLVVEPPKSGEARASAEDTYQWSRRWMEAEQDAAADRPAALAAAEAHVARMKELAQRAETLHKAGQTSAGQLTAARYYQVDAEWAAAKHRAN